MLISSLLTLFISCMSDGGGYDPCNGSSYSNSYCCYGNERGKLHFSKSDSAWVPTAGMGTFTNSNKYTTQFIRNSYNWQPHSSPANYKTVGCSCGGSSSCFDYISTDAEESDFAAADIPLTYTYLKTAVVDYRSPKNDTIRGHDLLMISVNNIAFNLPMNRDSIKNWTQLSSIHLHNRTYTNVYHVYTDSSRVDTTLIIPRGIFYSVGKGLVGFYLTNGETWELQ